MFEIISDAYYQHIVHREARGIAASYETSDLRHSFPEHKRHHMLAAQDQRIEAGKLETNTIESCLRMFLTHQLPID